MGPPRTRVDGVISEEPDELAGAPWRLRDLRGRDRRLAIGMVVLVLVPFVVGLVRAFHDGWIPSGDEANIATRALDVFSRHPPLIGLPSTSALYGHAISTNHPGPIEFYVLAIPLRMLGITAGPLLTAAAINGTFVLISLWVFFRRLGLAAMLWAGVLLLAVMFSGGTSVLTDTLSSNMTMYSLLCTAVLAWALMDGDLRLLPLAALVASYAAQQHLAAGLMVLALVVVGVVTLAAQVVTRKRRGDEAVAKVARRASLAAVAVAAVCWVTVVIDEITGHPGNFTTIVRFAQDPARPKLGFESGFHQWLHAVVPPTVLGRTDTDGYFFVGDPETWRIVLGVLMLGALVAIAVRARRQSPGVARLAVVALVLTVAGVVNGSNVPKSFESGRVNLYRWTWTAALITWMALGMGTVLLLRRFAGRSSITTRTQRQGPIALLVVAALITTSTVIVHGTDDHNRELPAFAAEKRIATAVLAKINRHRPVFVIQVGQDAQLSVVPNLIFQLVKAGVKVEVPGLYTSTYGTNRQHQASSDATTISVSSGRARRPAGFGELLAYEAFGPGRTKQFDALATERSRLLDELAATVRGTKIELAPEAKTIIDREHPGLAGFTINLLFNNLSRDPLTALGDPEVLKLLLRGIVHSPVFDLNKIRQVLTLPASHHRGPFGDEQVEVHLLTPTQAALCALHPCFSPQ